MGDRLAAGDAGDNEREGITRSWLTGGFSQLPNSGEDRFAIFAKVWELTEAAGEATPSDPLALIATGVSSREPIPHLSEPWYC